MSRLRVYTAAPYGQRAVVRVAIHAAIAAIGCDPVSSWAMLPGSAPEDLDSVPLVELVSQRARNFADVDLADLLFVYDPERKGRETYAEAARAMEARKPLVMVGSPTLSIKTYPAAVCFDGHRALQDAIEHLRSYAAARVRVA